MLINNHESNKKKLYFLIIGTNKNTIIITLKQKLMFLTGIIIYVIDENKQNNLNNVKHKFI